MFRTFFCHNISEASLLQIFIEKFFLLQNFYLLEIDFYYVSPQSELCSVPRQENL